MRTILITGFEPFGGDRRNPSGEIALALDGRRVGRDRLVGAVLPCVFGRSRRELRRLIGIHRPALVIAVGLAGNRADVTPERVAINVDDARIPDNAGQRPIDRAIVKGGPAAYWSRLPVKAIVAALRRRRIPASVSQTAGTFVCNHVFYGLMHAIRRTPGVRGGFIHVPWPADWPGAARGSVTLDRLAAGIAAAVAVSLRARGDLRRTGGAEQ